MNDVQTPQLAIDILRRLAKELAKETDQSAGVVDYLHALVERSAWLDGAQNSEFVRSAQSIDILQQRLAEHRNWPRRSTIWAIVLSRPASMRPAKLKSSEAAELRQPTTEQRPGARRIGLTRTDNRLTLGLIKHR
jgi:hypothetical protein